MKFQKTKSLLLQVALLVAAIISSHLLQSQAWYDNLPQTKAENGTLTLHDYQKAFNDYWEPYQVENGYYVQNGERIKAPYWKQFKRWEWFWEMRVDPQTGAFPNTTAADEYHKYLLENGGGLRSPSGNWTSMGPSSSGGGYAGIGRLNCVAFRPGDNNTIYAGAASGGIWKTTNGGTTWTPLGDQNDVLGVSDIIVINGSPDILYIATGDKDGGSLWSLGGQQSNDNNSVGVLKSTDGGTTWNSTGLSWTASQKNLVSRLILDPTSGNQTIYAATSLGVYKTTNGGTNWTLQLAGNFIDMEINPSNSSILYASTIDYWGGPQIYYTTNGGTNWSVGKTFATTDYRVDIAVTAANSSYVYAVVSDRSSGNNGGLSTIERSTNSGVSFSQVYSGSTNLLNWDCSSSSGGGQGSYDLCIIADPSSANTVFVGGVNTWKSTDGGSTWNINTHWSGTCGGSATTVHADQHFMAYQPVTSDLFLCNDGGIYKTTNGGNSWTDLTNSMVISQIYRLGVGQSNANDVITGLQDNGTKVYSFPSWTDEIGGDGMECIVDYTTNNTQYGTLYFGDIRRTTNHGGSWTQIGPSSGAWVTPFAMDPTSNTTLIAGYSDVYKTTNQGNNWTTISSGLTGGTDLRSVAIAPSNSNYIYVATLSNIWRTTVGGGTWTNITGSLPVGSSQITYISVKDTDPNTVWVSLGGYNTHGVYQTINGGSSWTNISTGLPSLPTMCVIQNTHNAAQNELYAATDVGVYVKVGTASWVPFSTGLPKVVVTELEIYYDANPLNSRLRAATYGRGLWESDLYSTVSAPVADFSGTPLSGNAPLSVTFTDASTGTITSYAWTFGDGGTSTQQNPVYVYNTPGTYDVSLTVTGPGGSDVETKTSYITVTTAAPVADFSGTPLSGNAPLSVTFTDASTGTITSYAWTFGDGGTSTLQNPSYDYSTPGTYDVSLTVTGPGGSDVETKTSYITVTTAAPVADFSGTPLSGNAPLSVTFTDASTGTITSYAWTFGDGGTSTQQNPVYVYNTPGTYDVSLTVTGPGGSDVETKTSYITVTTAAPVADFSGTPLSGNAPLSVTFTDASTGTITSYAWTFGDGGTSTLQNPSYDYSTPGTYDVSLTVTGPGGSDVETKTNYITVAVPAPVADFIADDTAPTIGQTVTFTDLSTNTPTSWTWVFTPGTVTYIGGTNANSQNPQVQFNAAGSYDVELTATNGSGSDTETKISYINATIPPPVADFVADNTTPETTETVNFTDLSTNTPTSWAWVFTPNTITYMNSTNANSQHPKVRFDVEGLYDAQLTATNAIGSDVELKTDYINCTNAPPPPDADFIADNLDPTILETVNFTDLSTNNPTTWAWVFTPSTITYMNGTSASSQHPEVRFDSPGAYTVELTATNAVGSDTEIKTDYINATDPPPVADFLADNLTPNTSETVSFTDLSTNNPTTWAWVFTPSTITYMNSTNSNSQHPEVRFDVAGTYTVELTATNAGGSDTETKTNYITASDPLTPPVADFEADNLSPTIEETVNFTDLSSNAPTSWVWSFSPSTITYMEGTNANSQHPKVRFDDPGAYTVELTATNAGGSDTEIKTDYINATVAPPVADFVADNTTPNVGETVTFTDLSTNTPTSWLWVFSPSTVTYVSGTDQNSQHPQLQFDANGLYTVELTATNGGGSDTEIKNGYINVGDVFEVIATANPDVICAGRSVLLQSFPSGGSGNYTFFWTSDPPGFTSNDQNVLAYPDITTTYTVEVDDGNQMVSADVLVTVNPLPNITLGNWPDILCHENEPPVQLTASPTGGIYSGPAVTMNGLFDPEVAPLGWNVITYTYTDALGCTNSAQDSIFVDDCVGIYNPNELNTHLILYPNPNDGKFTMSCSHIIKRIEIINQMGELIASEKYNAKEVQLNIILPKGLYFVRTIVTDKNNKTALVNKSLMIQ